MHAQVSAKCALAARVDAANEAPFGDVGVKFKEAIESTIMNVAAPPPQKRHKALPAPDEKPKKRLAVSLPCLLMVYIHLDVYIQARRQARARDQGKVCADGDDEGGEPAAVWRAGGRGARAGCLYLHHICTEMHL